MHIFVFSLLGLFIVSGLIYLYRDIKKMSSWRIENHPGEGNWDDQLMGDGLSGLESAQVERAAADVADQVEHLVTGVGHFWHH
jgi:hypothetical protein